MKIPQKPLGPPCQTLMHEGDPTPEFQSQPKGPPPPNKRKENWETQRGGNLWTTTTPKNKPTQQFLTLRPQQKLKKNAPKGSTPALTKFVFFPKKHNQKHQTPQNRVKKSGVLETREGFYVARKLVVPPWFSVGYSKNNKEKKRVQNNHNNKVFPLPTPTENPPPPNS